MSALDALLDAPRRALWWHRAAPWLATSVGVAGLCATFLPHLWALTPLVLGGALAFRQKPSYRAVARTLDRLAQLEGAVECAWDHRTATDPMRLAQRRRAANALNATTVSLPKPASVWALAMLTWVGPFVVDRADVASRDQRIAAASEPKAPGTRGAAEEDADRVSAAPDAATDRTASAVGKSKRDGAPSETSDDTSPSGKSGATVGAVGGVGGKAGAIAAARAKAAEGRRTDGDPILAVGRGRGPASVVARGTADAPPVAPTQLDDDVTDPARSYPVQYRAVVQAYFSRANTP